MIDAKLLARIGVYESLRLGYKNKKSPPWRQGRERGCTLEA